MSTEIQLWEGTNNKFVFLNGWSQSSELTSNLAINLCKKFKTDGVMLMLPGDEEADMYWRFKNGDGSDGEMCGNGSRCAGLWVVENGYVNKRSIRLGTDVGIKTLDILDSNNVRVDMGPPIFEPNKIPVNWSGDNALDAEFIVGGDRLKLACVSMGNPHAVYFTDDKEGDLNRFGKLIESHSAFPRRTNAGFVEEISSDKLSAVVFERGVGRTDSCGTGACAAAVVSRIEHGTKQEVCVVMPGGELIISWQGSLEEERFVSLTGPAQMYGIDTIDLQEYQ